MIMLSHSSSNYTQFLEKCCETATRHTLFPYSIQAIQQSTGQTSQLIQLGDQQVMMDTSASAAMQQAVAQAAMAAAAAASGSALQNTSVHGKKISRKLSLYEYQTWLPCSKPWPKLQWLLLPRHQGLHYRIHQYMVRRYLENFSLYEYQTWLPCNKPWHKLQWLMLPWHQGLHCRIHQYMVRQYLENFSLYVYQTWQKAVAQAAIKGFTT